MSKSPIFVGSNYFGQCSGSKVESEDTITSSPLDIQCGSSFTVELHTDNKVYLSGWMNGSHYGIRCPVSFQSPLSCIAISCGRKHAIALTEGGFVFSWGSGYLGQLGHGDDACYDSPRRIETLDPRRLQGDKVVRIMSGGYHNGVVTQSGRVYLWGLNRSGQCGVDGASTECAMEPCPMSMPLSQAASNSTFPFNLSITNPTEKCKQLFGGKNHTVMLTQSGRLFSWGSTSFGRLGINSPSVDAAQNVGIGCGNASRRRMHMPLEVIIPNVSSVRGSTNKTTEIVSIACGDCHNLALVVNRSSSGDVIGTTVYSWGYNGEGQCGHGTVMHVKTPLRIDYFSNILNRTVVRSVHCGANFSLAVVTDLNSGLDEVYGWGSNDFNWMGVSSVPETLPYYDSDATNNGPTTMFSFSQAKSFDCDHMVLTPHRLSVSNNLRGVKFSVRCGQMHFAVFENLAEERDSVGLPAMVSGRKDREEKDGVNSRSDSKTADRQQSSAGREGSVLFSKNSKLAGSFSRPTVNKRSIHMCIQEGQYDSFRSMLHMLRHNQDHSSRSNSAFLEELCDEVTRDSLLMIACRFGQEKIVRLLCEEYGADPNESNIDGNTALHYCFHAPGLHPHIRESISQFLITKCNADEFKTNKLGLTCYEGLTMADIDKM